MKIRILFLLMICSLATCYKHDFANVLANEVTTSENKEILADQITLQDMIQLSGKPKQALQEFGQQKGLIIHKINNNNLVCFMHIKLYDNNCIVCFKIDELSETIEKIYMKPENAKMSEWIRRCNTSFGQCINVESSYRGETDTKNQEVKCMTWLFNCHYISIIQMNHTMYLYVTVSD